MVIHVVVGGPKELIPPLREYNGEDVIWVGVDRGVVYLLEEGITPDRAFGDFDSVTGEELDWMRERVSHLDIYPAEKNETDMELALSWAIQQKPEKIFLFGATGGRLDHMLANVQILIKSIDSQIEMSMVDTKNMIHMQAPGKYHLHINKQYPYVSFLPFTREVRGIFLDGFKYSLSNKDISWGSTLCVSNELVVEKGTYSFEEGIIIVVRSKD